MMKKNKTNLGKRIHMYNSLQDMEKQFANDVHTLGEEIAAVANKLDVRNPWDQSVLVAVMTNVLACVTVNAMFDGVNLEQAIRDNYNHAVEEYKKIAAKEIVKGNI